MRIPSAIKTGFDRVLHTEYVERRLLTALLLLLGYSVFVGVVSYDTRPPLIDRAMTDRHEMDGMLVRTSNGLHFYDFSQLHADVVTIDFDLEPVDPTKPIPVAYEELQASGSVVLTRADAFERTAVLRDNLLITRGEGGSQLYDARERLRYDLVPDASEMISMDTKGDIVFTTAGDAYALRYFFPACNDPYEIELEKAAFDVPSTMKEKGLPLQSKLLFSPSQQTIAVLDHAHQSRITLVDTVSKRTTVLSVPNMGENQLHFSPLFLDSETIVFSALDDTRHATISYGIRNQTYSVLSENFSDEAYLSRNGDLVLLQSFAPRTGNVPFGSFPMMMEKSAVHRQEIISFWGDDDVEWMRFFENPNEDLLRFRKGAETEFPEIENPARREGMAAVWKTLLDPLAKKTGELRIVKLQGGAWSVVGARSFEVSETRPYFLWRESVGLLLTHLDIPRDVVAAYEENSSEALRSRRSYEILDLH